MGPTNLALLELFRADTALREAQTALDEATRGVRVQKKRADLAHDSHNQTLRRLKQARAQQMEFDSDLKARDARIEHLRQQQEEAHNHKQFQNFLVEINNQKLDRSRIEEQAVQKLNEIEELQKLETQQAEAVATERQRADQLEAEIGGKTAELQAEIRRLEPEREAAAAKVPPKALTIFDRLADNYDGEAMSAVGHIEGRTEGYFCTACNMELVVDVYNRLMTRDEVLTCPGCGRMLYVPEELTPERAVRLKKPKTTRKSTRKTAKKATKSAAAGGGLSADMKRIISTAAAESLRQAELDEQPPMEVEVLVGNASAGTHRVKDEDDFRRLIVGKVQAQDIEAQVTVKAVGDRAAGAPAAPRPETQDRSGDAGGLPMSTTSSESLAAGGAPAAGMTDTTDETIPVEQPSQE